ncbi:hypothetical protein GUITHDRAFT_137554 [Guillardia theta CCMP2712]|uniref:K Homology domain-containing protein n=2 Tax=Guillardia theta TaxID=55529 RepID=L1JH08_GUITC|nr:hypothetical protein GUITHDRAFT_137554 [Guillardia theta CCMP2712]EKX47380.1 hypothetical protein GUITHDRAFT_137554 [Guillardia theta CCMP2712]|mmetsp:Transcript_32776/g.103696  ORF Transcript_32776/g.103696 Transcript_32776/m.103696 type:complete len:267 (+) Transcript_32776:95-895(+)|eukprot:XP_005834360.1 hypothetical protein GUITHDRAFT_137554 [Guillardia theta CCMP2712]
MGNTDSKDTPQQPGAAASKPQAWNAADKNIRLELDIQKEKMGKLIGTGGKTIQLIQQKVSTIQMKTPSKEDTGNDEFKFVPVQLQGRAQDVFKAAQMVDEVATACLAVLSATVSPQQVSLLQRESILNMQKEIPIDTLRLPKKTDKPPRVVIEGYLEDVKDAYHFIIKEVEIAAKEVQEERENMKLMQIRNHRMGSEDSNESGQDGKKKAGRDNSKMQPKRAAYRQEDDQKASLRDRDNQPNNDDDSSAPEQSIQDAALSSLDHEQ